jgi:2-polyprenyl-6-methoxyphenol hydroxylase-like FAD-dependent oxidoreductase
MNDTTVLIVGAGPTGLTLAVELARTGVPFRLIDASDGPQQGSRGKGVQPRTLEVFEDLGVIDRALANGQLAMPMRQIAPDGSFVMAGVDVPAPTPDVPYTSTLITPEWRVEETLRLRLEELGGSVSFGTALQGFTQTADGVTATIVADGATSTVTARWLVGCDGGHSVVRKQSGIEFVGETLEDVRMLVADVRVTGLDRDAWSMWRSATGMVTLCPLPSTDLFQYQASVAPGQDPSTELENLQAILVERTGRTDIALADPAWTSLWRANVRIVDRYRDGGVFLAGDAAHIHSPAGGQGMNTGIQDAHNLGWKLAAVWRGEAPDALLDTYESERRPIALGVLALSNARLRQAIENGQVPVNRTRTTMQLDVGYRDSVLSRDDRADADDLRAGDRAPDATGLVTSDGEHRLFDLLRGGRWTLLVFGDAVGAAGAPEGLRILRVLDSAASVGTPTDGTVVDTAGTLRSAYGATDRSLVLIRPDGCIARISDVGDPAAVLTPFAALG